MQFLHPSTISYRPALEADFGPIALLLHACNLPNGDLNPAHQQFLLAESGGLLVGCAAIERYDHYGLFRSLAVADSFRGLSIAATLLQQLIVQSSENGITILYLLTTGAADYFRRKGWKETCREMVAPAVGRSSEFASLCPASAVCMSIQLLQ